MNSISLKEVLQAIQGTTVQKENLNFNRVFIDSRQVPNRISSDIRGIFFALEGAKFNGHNFVPNLLDRGIDMAVVNKGVRLNCNPDKLIFVDSTLHALGDLAAYYKSFYEIPVIGITGSIGKTIAKEFVANVLAQRFSVHKTQGNLNSIIGLPLTLFDLDYSHEISVLEMGSDHFGEIRRLTQIAKPSIAVITSIGPAHLEFFGDLKGVIREKTDIFRYAHKNSLKIYNGDTQLRELYKGVTGLVSYGKNKDNDFVISSISQNNGKLSFLLNDDPYFIESPVKHNVMNAIPSIIIGKYYDLSSHEIQKGLSQAPKVALRMEILKNRKKDWVVIADCYNANPQSMRAALDFLSKYPQTNRFAILGDMLELGRYSEVFHKEIGELLSVLELNSVISIGNLSNMFNSSYHFQTVEDCLKLADLNFPPHSVILVKGSRNLHLEKIVERLV
jgi:UDP-N-acetylmuramoyl-tripeptide--D-alanyl-D-alanine ligase